MGFSRIVVMSCAFRSQELSEFVQRAVPALAMAFAVGGGGQALMHQSQAGAAAAKVLQRDADKGVALAAERPAPSEGETMRAFDQLEHAFDRNLAPALHMHDQMIAAADA